MQSINPTTSSDWDNAVLQHPDATVFHSSAWARVLVDTYGHQPLYQLGTDGSKLKLAFPVMEARSWLAGRRGVCLPFSDFCGPLGDSTKTVREVVDLGCERGWRFFEWRQGLGDNHGGHRGHREDREKLESSGPPPHPIPLPPARGEGDCRSQVLDVGRSSSVVGPSGRRASTGPEPETVRLVTSSATGTGLRTEPEPEPIAYLQFYHHTLQLARAEAELFDRLDSSMRRAIRKAEKSGVSVSVSIAPEAMENYFRLHCLTRRKHGLPPQSVTFFRNIQRHLIDKSLGFIVSALHQGRTIAASMYLWFGRNALYKFGASDEAFLNLRANNLVMWTAIRELAQRGFASLAFGRTSLANDGLRRFKQSWGTTETIVNYHRYDFREQRYVSGEDKATGWYNPVFRIMPAALARPVGAAMYKHLV